LWGESVNTRLSALNKVSEYLMAGLPIACTAYPNLERIVHYNPIGPVGETFDVLSPDSIAKTIRRLLDQGDTGRYRENALLLAHSLLNWEHEELRLLDIYGRVYAKLLAKDEAESA